MPTLIIDEAGRTTVYEILDDDGLMISDVGAHKIWIARNFPTCCPNGCIVSNGLASMGIALPCAIAASLVGPGRLIVAAMGDCGCMQTSQGLQTATGRGVHFTARWMHVRDFVLRGR